MKNHTEPGTGNAEQPTNLRRKAPLSQKERARRAAKTKFKCSAEWHIHHRNHLAVSIYTLAMHLCKPSENGQRRFYASVRNLADYFGVSTNTVLASLSVLRELGFFVPLGSGTWETDKNGKPTYRQVRAADGEFLSNDYLVLSHSEFEAKHPGLCFVPEATTINPSQPAETAQSQPAETAPSQSTETAQSQPAETKSPRAVPREETRKNARPAPKSGADPFSSSHAEAADAAGGQQSLSERRSVSAEYFLWLNQTWLDLSLSRSQKLRAREFILGSSCDLHLLKLATARILDTLDVTNSYDRAGERLAENLPEKCAAMQAELTREKEEQEHMARQRAEMRAQAEQERIEEPEDALFGRELPEAN